MTGTQLSSVVTDAERLFYAFYKMDSVTGTKRQT